MESFSKSRPTHWTAAVVTQLFPGHMFSKQGRQAVRETLLLSPAVTPFIYLKNTHTQRGESLRVAGIERWEPLSVIPHYLSIVAVSEYSHIWYPMERCEGCCMQDNPTLGKHNHGYDRRRSVHGKKNIFRYRDGTRHIIPSILVSCTAIKIKQLKKTASKEVSWRWCVPQCVKMNDVRLNNCSWE